MIEKDDWRLTGGEEHLNGQKFKKIRFPDFWHKSFREQNAFYKKIVQDAEKFVKEHKSGEEWLKDEQVQAFWHEHCYFCWKKFMTDKPNECFCTPDYNVWICKSCFEDFRVKFNLIALGDD